MQALINALVLGAPSLWLLAPALLRVLRSRAVLVPYGLVGALTLICMVPGCLVLADPLSSDKQIKVGWFSYALEWDSLGDGMLSNTFPSTHSILLALVALHGLAWVTGRRGRGEHGRGTKDAGLEPARAQPPLSPDQARALANLRYDPNARRSYEVFSGGFKWTDETTEAIWHAQDAEGEQWYVLRYLWAYRASLIRGCPDESLRATWEAVLTNYPEWPGFRPERRSVALAPELDAEARVAMDDIEQNGLFGEGRG